MSGHGPLSLSSHVTRALATRYTQLLSLTLILYDHLITFDKEVAFVWKGASPRSWPRVVFLLARYAAPIALIINTYPLLGPKGHDGPDSVIVSVGLRRFYNAYEYLLACYVSCKGWLFFHGWSGFVFFAGIQVISQMRLWAMYRSRLVLVFMTVVICLALIAMAIIEGLGYTGVIVKSIPVTSFPQLHICGPQPGTLVDYAYAFWIPPLIVEIISLALVGYKTFIYYHGTQHRDWAGARLMESLVRYSVLYFAVVLGLYLANLYIWANLPTNAFEIAIPLTYALPSIAGNRMLLSLRSVFYETHAELPVRNDSINLTRLNPERGLAIHTHNPLKEFESFFGEHQRDS